MLVMRATVFDLAVFYPPVFAENATAVASAPAAIVAAPPPPP
jgi:hypothetical protein